MSFPLTSALELRPRLVFRGRGVRDILAIKKLGAITIAKAGFSFVSSGWNIIADGIGISFVICESFGLGEAIVVLGSGIIGGVLEDLDRGLLSSSYIHYFYLYGCH